MLGRSVLKALIYSLLASQSTESIITFSNVDNLLIFCISSLLLPSWSMLLYHVITIEQSYFIFSNLKLDMCNIYSLALYRGLHKLHEHLGCEEDVLVFY